MYISKWTLSLWSKRKCMLIGLIFTVICVCVLIEEKDSEVRVKYVADRRKSLRHITGITDEDGSFEPMVVQQRISLDRAHNAVYENRVVYYPIDWVDKKKENQGSSRIDTLLTYAPLGIKNISPTGVKEEAAVDANGKKIKSILLYGRERYVLEEDSLIKYECPVSACELTRNQSILWDPLKQPDAVIFGSEHNISAEALTSVPKPAGQVWVLRLLESPFHTTTFASFSNKINWTATYRRDSTIVTPYGEYIEGSRPLFHEMFLGRLESKNDIWYKKQRLVAWFVSNCGSKNGRLSYVMELQKYIQVDVYGICGPLKCPLESKHDCLDLLRREYKFYLAFENSNCVDYITEKFWNALSYDVVPVVMGPSKEAYLKVAPRNSFIHVDDFASPKDLGIYLEAVAKDPVRYSRFFDWKRSGRIHHPEFWCDLCAKLHSQDKQVSWYPDIDDWWRGQGVCQQANLADFKLHFDVTNIYRNISHNSSMP